MLKIIFGRNSFLSFLFLFAASINAQTKNNLDIFYKLIDSSGNNIINHLSSTSKNLELNLTLGESYKIFNNHLISIFLEWGYKIENNLKGEKILVNYTLDNAKVSYGNIFRDGLFGTYLLSRSIEISGNYLIKDNSGIFKNFKFSNLDTIKVDSIKMLENSSYPFTQGVIPSEPFFSSLFEPLIAIGTAAIAIFLFFTIRSR